MIFREIINLLNEVISNWETSILEKHWPEILKTLKSALYDADPDARTNARHSYEVLQNLYPMVAEQLFNVGWNSHLSHHQFGYPDRNWTQISRGCWRAGRPPPLQPIPLPQNAILSQIPITGFTSINRIVSNVEVLWS